MPNGGPDCAGYSREELTHATDIVVVAKKALAKIEMLKSENRDLREALKETNRKLGILTEAISIKGK